MNADSRRKKCTTCKQPLEGKYRKASICPSCWPAEKERLHKAGVYWEPGMSMDFLSQELKEWINRNQRVRIDWKPGGYKSRS